MVVVVEVLVNEICLLPKFLTALSLFLSYYYYYYFNFFLSELLGNFDFVFLFSLYF